jgi:hypothetical protein
MANPLFILSSGRSGSTLLQRVLNSYEQVTIWGEHAGFLAPLADSYFRLLENPGSREYLFPGTEHKPLISLADLEQRKDPRQWQAWINFVTPGDVTTFFRQHVESFLRHPVMGDDHVWGFKEIRYGGRDRVIEFLHELFPDAVFVFLCRNALSTLASQRHTFHGTTGLGRLVPTRRFLTACRAWREQNRALRDWHLSGKLRSHWLRFEELAEKGENSLQSVLAALGLEFGERQRMVFELDEGRGSRKPQTEVVDRWRNLGWLPLLAAEAVVGEVNATLGYESPRAVRWARPLRRRLVGGARQAARATDVPQTPVAAS